jgi:flavin reductase (DIM6/NTAB) family NADH-FMN oxidoreductase RutF
MATTTTTTTTSPFHGATLSSFTSISMAPHHLVAFSLRVPSRMAASLADLSSAAQQPSLSAHMVINLLAAPQTHAAILFSRPDLYPRPFEDPGIQWSLSRDGLPILHGCLGALSCRVVGAPWPLNNLTVLGDKPSSKVEGTRDGGDIESELFIAEVLRVEDVPQVVDVGDDDTIRTLPLVYHRRSYTTTTDKLPLNQKTNS